VSGYAGLQRLACCNPDVVRGGLLQVVRVLPELRATMHFLWENRRAWHERYMVELANDRNKSAAEKEAERVRSVTLMLQACTQTVTAEMPPLAAAQALKLRALTCSC